MEQGPYLNFYFAWISDLEPRFVKRHHVLCILMKRLPWTRTETEMQILARYFKGMDFTALISNSEFLELLQASCDSYEASLQGTSEVEEPYM